MLSIEYIKNNKEEVAKGAKDKGADVDLDKVLELAEKQKKAKQGVDELRAERNRLSQIIAKDSDNDSRQSYIKKAEGVKKELRDSERYLREVEDELELLVNAIPNIPFEEAPIGKDDTENVVLRKEGNIPDFSFKPKDYLEIAEKNNLIDIERASKVSGSRFGYLKNEGVVLEFALVNLALNIVGKKGFSPVVPPVLIKPEYMKKMGYLEREPEDLYYLEKDDLHLVGTSEQSIAPMYAGETLPADDLPQRMAGFSSCFRREAGSYGKDTRGILRVHQFDKVEMVSFTHPDKSKEEHRLMLSLQEELMTALEIPYQVVHISTGDMGFPTAEQFDIESWIPSEGKYRETHSTSNTTDFQARRLGTKFRDKNETQYVHILNGTAYAIGRTIISILENHQTDDGGVYIPKALQKYTGFDKIG